MVYTINLFPTRPTGFKSLESNRKSPKYYANNLESGHLREKLLWITAWEEVESVVFDEVFAGCRRSSQVRGSSVVSRLN